MDPTTEIGRSTAMSATEFYDALSPDYDSMTGFQKRFVHEKPFFRLLLERFKIRTALDAGCGTGFHSLLLAQLGVRVTAIDISPAMLSELQKHARELNVTIDAVRAQFTDLKDIEGAPFDAVFVMGNSLAHLLSDEENQIAIENFASLLNPGGILFIQNLNYNRILATRNRVQSVKEAGGKTFVRFYDYAESLVTFNILTIDKDAGIVRQNLKSVNVKPVLAAGLTTMLLRSQFEDITSYGSIALDEYVPESSKDLIVLARKKVGG